MTPTITPPAMGASPMEVENKHKTPIDINLMCVLYSYPKI